MCGIIACFSTTVKKGKKTEIKATKVNDLIVNQYQDQHTRGQRGFGIIRIDKKGNIELDRACEPTKFLIDLYMKESEMIIAHHRTPTSTDNKIDQTHPMYVSNKILKHDYYVMHNGMLSNDIELHKLHDEFNFKYTTEYTENSHYGINSTKQRWNDSEALAIELALFIEKKIKVIRTDNSAAFVILQVNKKTNIAERVFFGKNGGSDLNISKVKGQMMISSEGAGDEVVANILWCFKIEDPTMELESQAIEFKKPYREIISSTIHHHSSCRCTDCVAKEAKDIVFPKTQTLLPLTQEINAKKDKGTTETTTEVMTTRGWVDLEDESIEDLSFENVIFADKNYQATTCEEFKGKMKAEDALSITHIIDDSLDEEVEKITDIVTSFKTTLIANKVDAPTENFFIAQVAKIIKTMTVMSDIAEIQYREMKLLEEEEEKEAEKEVAEYNLNWKGTEEKRYAGNQGYSPYEEYGYDRD
jgi:predicted glutamine amidotransferase